jgi:hypothetical protein
MQPLTKKTRQFTAINEQIVQPHTRKLIGAWASFFVVPLLSIAL